MAVLLQTATRFVELPRHALVTEETARENFYVVISRARNGTVLYFATHELAASDEDQLCAAWAA